MTKIRDIIQKIVDTETSAKKWNIVTLGVAAAVILGSALLVFIVDPHYRYHKPLFYDMVYHKVYATAPHILKNEQYDLLMLGTSMTRNFFISDIDSAFNCRSVKLAASGGTAKDIVKFFEIARNSKKDSLKRVVLSLDVYSLNKSTPRYQEFDYLYSDGHSQDYRYLFSRQTFSSMIYLIKRKHRPKRNRAHQTDRNRMFSTDYAGKPYGLAEVVKDARGNEFSHHTQTPYAPKLHQENFYRYLLPVFDRNPQIKFTVYLPPYHIYTYCQSEKFGEADALIRQRSSVMRELIKRKNVELHDFQADPKFVRNHDYFCDVQHFSNAAAREVLRDLLSGRRRIVSEAQIAANEQELRALIRNNMDEYNHNIKHFRGR